MENPAVSLYNLWREIIRWHGEQHVNWFRSQVQEHVDRRIASDHVTWHHIQDDGEVEKYSTGMYTGGYNASHAPLDYRMSLRVVGITDRHLYDTPTLGPDMSVFEPIISLQVTHTGWRSRHAGKTVPLMHLYPNGDFTIWNVPSAYHQIYPRWTFFRTTWIASKRQWLVPPVGGHPLLNKQPHWSPGWVNFDEKDWTNPIPYLPNHSFVVGAHYQLVPDVLGFWKVSTQRDSRVGEYDFRKDGESAILLREGYARSQRRYRRFERSSEIAKAQRTREKIAIYVPGQGRFTGDAAVEQFTHNMRVYEPVQAVKEATDGDPVVTSPVRQ